jgi:hypothetical protein
MPADTTSGLKPSAPSRDQPPRQLEVISSDGQRLAGGRPSSGGRTSSWRAGRQEVLLGFQGRAKTWLDALQPVIADFQDALRWEPVREEEDP